MVGKFFSSIVRFLIRKPLVFFGVLISLVLFFVAGVRRLNVDENIYSIFPQGEEFQQFNSILKENNLNKQVLFSLSTEGRDEYEISDLLDSISGRIERESEGLLTNFQVHHEGSDQEVLDYMYSNLYAFLDQSDYSEISGLINRDSVEARLSTVADRMQSANALFLRRIVAKDPLGIGWKQLQRLNPRNDSAGLQIQDGILYTANGKEVIFTADLGFELDENEKNEYLNIKLESIKDELVKKDKLEFDYFGTFQISYANSKQVKADTYLTMIISLSLILLLLIVYYRSLLVPLYFVIPAIFSALAGLGIVGYFHPTISAISIATSAVLLGIVLDYSFHFFTHARKSNDVLESVKELSFPMLVGSFTTVAAFAALIFTDSVVLQNFGWISLFTLISAVLFTLILLPVFLQLVKFDKRKDRSLELKFTLPKWVFRVSFYGIILLTVFFIFKAQGVSFDAELNNLSYHTSDLAQKEEHYTGINPRKEKKLHFFVKGDDQEKVKQTNFELYEVLRDFRDTSELDELISVAPYQLPAEIRNERFAVWSSYWSKHKDSVQTLILEDAVKFDFSDRAFVPFFKWISETEQETEVDLIDQLGLAKFSYRAHDEWTSITSAVVNKDKLESLKTAAREVEGVFVLDVGEMTSSLINSVQNDFNYLLLFSSLMVFFSLLVVYGRIELALFSMLPMVISWIWILGIASIGGIEFNFVNIIVATFIFGLGDDFSIFVTDGLQQQYSVGKNHLKSYRAAIILSGLTTIIGTGALYFAKHPAIHSIAAISVVGITCILIVTLVLQPALYRFFVTNRTAKRRSPMTLLGLVYSIFLFSYFFVGCLVLNVFLLPLIALPIPKVKKRRWLNYAVSKLAKSTLYLGVHVKKEIKNKERLDFSKPSIIVANHSSFLDILLMIMMDPKVIIMVKKWVYYSPVFGFFIRYSGYLFIAEGTEYNLELIRKRIDNGYSVMIFPEGTRSRDGIMKRFHKGAFYLAQELKLDIQPILIVGAHYVNPKNDLIIKSGSLILVPLERISHEDPLYQERFGVMTKKVQALMRDAWEETCKEIETAKYLGNRVQYNYLYKGPILEWYIRVKWMFERSNFDHYDQLLGDRKRIYDIGCGYGYLSYFLHYRSDRRVITGLDYDGDKIAIAQHGYDKDQNLQFEECDIRSYTFENADAFFFNDVLHYLLPDEQISVLEQAVKNLSSGGIMIIRDGITDLNDRHVNTQKTEKYSTEIVKFNRADNPLYFFSSKDIFNFAKQHSLECEMLEQSQKTSNVLFILRKH